jgi:excisionase family DNA binding protein
MILSIIEAAKRMGVGRSTLYAMRKRGNISFIKRKDGSLGIDLSELERVFQSKTSPATPGKTLKDIERHDLSLAAMEKDRAHLQDKVKFLENQLALEQDRVATLLEINKNNSEKLLLTHQEHNQPSLWKRIFG